MTKKKKVHSKECGNNIISDEGEDFVCPHVVSVSDSDHFRGVATVITTLVGFFTILGFILGGYSFLDQRYALAKNFVILEKRVETNEVRHLYHSALSELYFFRAQARSNPKDTDLNQKLEDVERDVNVIRDRLDNLMKK